MEFFTLIASLHNLIHNVSFTTTFQGETMTDVRIERDYLGEMEIPNDQYYGIQTHRMEKVSGTANLPVILRLTAK